MDSLRKFVLGIAVCFGLPWFVLVVRPYIKERNRQPIPFTSNETHPELKGNVDTEFYEDPLLRNVVYPAAPSGNYTRGAVVYGRMGCVQCHTQMIRPTYLGNDSWKVGNGENQDNTVLKYTRHTKAEDYINENFAMLGQRRLGPDFANAGYRFKSATDIYMHLYAPRQVKTWSTHPTYPSLFDEKLIEGPAPRADSLPLEGKRVKPGFQIVPNGDAVALAEYLMGQKRTERLPISLTGQTMASKAAEAKK
jgi:cytochrome c oxidase cbb3-type subunit 2